MKATNKQTAVNWLMDQFTKNYPLTKESAESIIKQAIEMEKEQMKAFYTMHIVDTRTMELFDFDEYYKQTYESNT